MRKVCGALFGKLQQLQGQNSGQKQQEQVRPDQLQQPEQLQYQQQQAQQAHQPQQPNLQHQVAQNMARAASQTGKTGSKPPPAPTSTAPPFPIGAPSPHGIPVYDGNSNSLTPDKLHLPPQKKRKNNNGSAASTPAQQGATPGSTSSPQLKMQQSPEQKRQHQQMKLEHQQRQERCFKCPDEWCNYNIEGFGKEEDLQAHIQEAHKKVEDPLEFFLHNAAVAFDVDADGTPKASKMDVNTANRGKQPVVPAKPQGLGTTTLKKEALKVDGQTPGKPKQGAVTPSPGFIKPMSPASGRTPKQRTQQHQAQASSATTPPKKTMLESMAEKAGISLNKTDEPKPDQPTQQVSASPIVGEDAFGKDDSLNFMHSISDALSGLENPYGDEMDLAFSDPSPALTPSSSQSGATNSTSSSLDNINETDRLTLAMQWDAFNMGSGVYMDFGNDFGMHDTGLQSTFDNIKPTQPPQNSKGDANEGKEKNDAASTHEPALNWESVFAAGSGLDKTDDTWDKDVFGNCIFNDVEFFDS